MCEILDWCDENWLSYLQTELNYQPALVLSQLVESAVEPTTSGYQKQIMQRCDLCPLTVEWSPEALL